jgi:hypothetical protein
MMQPNPTPDPAAPPALQRFMEDYRRRLQLVRLQEATRRPASLAFERRHARTLDRMEQLGALASAARSPNPPAS